MTTREINAGGFGTVQFSASSGNYVLYSCKRGCESLFESA